MKKVQLALNEAAGVPATQAGAGVANTSRRQLRQQTEELRVKVLDMAEHHMDVTVQVLKRWLKTSEPQ